MQAQDTPLALFMFLKKSSSHAHRISKRIFEQKISFGVIYPGNHKL